MYLHQESTVRFKVLFWLTCSSGLFNPQYDTLNNMAATTLSTGSMINKNCHTNVQCGNHEMSMFNLITLSQEQQ